ncbi:zinc finger BED domain-containing protein 5 [Trichonephila clavipes]|nr:zinc finger BED domain-containing protein 5 [Trichonephila clavipes]
MTHPDIPIFYGYNAPSRRGNVSPFARVRPQRWGKKDAFHRIPFLVNRANVKTAIITLGTGDLPSVASYEWIRDLFQDTPEGLSTSEKEIFIAFTSSEKLKRQFCNKSLFEFWVEVDDELSALKTKALRILLSLSTSYLC